ncbi:hypothetical protein BYT27DRAFT_7210779 [Phlegmacium glaucopus]|nr:hypothetical protein BYT27DRAFT_7210779 [Phlegmacium glaucopus]
MASTPFHPMDHRCHTRQRIFPHSGKPTTTIKPKKVLADLHGGDLNNSVAQAEFEEIRDKVISEISQRESGEGIFYKTMWTKYKRRALLAMSSPALAQLNGINGDKSFVITYLTASKLIVHCDKAGWIGRQAILMTGINTLIYVLSTLPPWYLVNRWDRRPIRQTS